MISFLLLIPAAISLFAVYAGHTRLRGREFVKTAVTLSLFAIVMLHGIASGWNDFSISVAVSLLFASAADYFLSTQHRQWYFSAGLFGFLIAYGLYGVVLHLSAGPTLIGAAVAVPALILLIIQYRTMPNLPPELKLPVIIYILVVSHLVVAGSAFAYTAMGDSPLIGILTVIAVLGIYFSDSLIAHNLFRRPLQKEELWILPPYYVAQICIVGVVLLRF